MALLVLGLGSNLGDRRGYLRSAIRALISGPSPAFHLRAISNVYETPALLPPNSPDEWSRPYLNAAISGTTHLEPIGFLRRTKEIERTLNRETGPRWSPRTVDIDLLAWEGLTSTSGTLKLPHPELSKRDFAINPFCDVAPEFARALGISFVDALQPSRYWIGPKIMAICNLTPDSFSGDGSLDLSTAVASAVSAVEMGAEVIDLGAESTRPGATPVSTEEEFRRLVPVLKTLRREVGNRAAISVDTRSPEVARAAVAEGADWLNDVSGFENPAMRAVAQNFSGPLVFMHSLTVPANKAVTLPSNSDVTEELLQWARTRMDALVESGISRDRLIFDPGIGFGKTAAQSVSILENVRRFHELDVPILIGHSRKSFLGDTPHTVLEKDRQTLAISKKMAAAGVGIVRVHDVRSHSEAFSDVPHV